MADHNIPYVSAYGNITKALQAIQKAQTPDRFTQEFLSTRLGLTGGSAKLLIPFLKKTGFLASDGAPTTLYKRFRNVSQGKAAAAEALRKGFVPLYEINEYAHDLSDPDLKGIIVQATKLLARLRHFAPSLISICLFKRTLTGRIRRTESLLQTKTWLFRLD